MAIVVVYDIVSTIFAAETVNYLVDSAMLTVCLLYVISLRMKKHNPYLLMWIVLFIMIGAAVLHGV